MLTVTNLTKTFGAKRVLSHVTTTFADNHAYVICGASGSGKSTLLNIIAKFEQPTSGQVTWQGNDIDKLSKHQYYRDVLGYLFQNYALIEQDTVDKNLDLGLIGKPKGNHKQAKQDALAAVNLDASYLKRRVYELSGGEQQRVAIARMFLKQPKVLLIDEPTAALDEQNSRAILAKFSDLLVQPGRVVIVATHDPLVREWADTVLNVADLNNA